MQFNSFCIVAGTETCTASCAWCVASMTPDKGVGKGKAKLIDQDVFNMACRMALKSNLDTARITGKGEPTIFPKQITEYLTLLKPHGFEIIELQTHGAHLANEDLTTLEDMREWSRLGMTHICISLVSYKPERNHAHYFSSKPRYKEYYDMAALITKLHKLRFNVRLTCIMQAGDIDSAAELARFMAWAKKVKADEVTVLPVNKPSDDNRNSAVYQAAAKAALSEAQLADIRAFADQGKVLKTLPWGAKVYDLNGQNLCLNYCLTHSPNVDASRQLIYYPPGTIGYDWEYEGATIYRLPAEATVNSATKLVQVTKPAKG